MEEKPWVCISCVTYFYPNQPDYLCPKCGGKSRPSILFDPLKHEIYQKPRMLPKEQKCPNCSTVMIPGMITEAAETVVGLQHHGSVLWTAHGPRFIFPPVNSFLPTAYACPKCGKIELYIQLISAHEKMEEKITRWVKETNIVGYCNICKTDYDFFKHGYMCPNCKKTNTEKRNSKLE